MGSTGTGLVIIGASGHGREIHEIVEAINDNSQITSGCAYQFLGFLDDGHPDLALLDAPYLGSVDEMVNLPQDTQYVIAVGDGRVRAQIDARATALGFQPATLIHPRATVGRSRIVIGPGSVLFPFVSLTTNINLGRHVHLNVGVCVGHDAVMDDFATVNPGATISGNVKLETQCTIGTGASVLQGVTIGRGSIIGAGAAVVRDIPPDVTAVGVPARPRPDGHAAAQNEDARISDSN